MWDPQAKEIGEIVNIEVGTEQDLAEKTVGLAPLQLINSYPKVKPSLYWNRIW